MAIAGIAALDGRLTLAQRPLAEGLAPLLRRVPRGAPIVILVHGYRFSPAQEANDPNRLIFSPHPVRPSRRIASWPLGLGFTETGAGDGLCLGFAWPASAEDHGGPLHARFARVYDAAGAAGALLAETVETIARLAPGRPVDLIAHSLGARVALAAAAALPPGRLGQIVLMGGAEWDGVAIAALERPGAQGARVYNIGARANALFDHLFTHLGPRPGPGQRPLGAGLGRHLGAAVDLTLDDPRLGPVLARRGIRLGPQRHRVCHWSFFTRPGALELNARILRERHNWTIPALKSETDALAPVPWSAWLPRLPWTPPDAGGPTARPAAGA